MNRFRNYVLMAASFVAVLVVVGGFTAGPAIAQAVRAALMSNVDDPGRIPYRFTQECSFAPNNSCGVSLPLVPNGKRLVITHISGELRENLPGGTLILAIIGNEVRLPVTFTGSSGGYNYFVFDQQELMFRNAGEGALAANIFLGDVPNAGSAVLFYFSGYMLDCNAGPCAAIQP